MEEIPPQLGNLLMLETINLSHNRLFGSIRSTFENGLFTICQRCKSKNKPLEGKNCERIFGISGDFGKRFYQDIIKATDEFNSNYCIGTGGHRHVDKAVLPSGQVVVVKKLHLSKNGELTNVNAFERELYGFCSHAKYSFLVCEFIEKGSSRVILNNEKQAMELDWFKRLNVVKGTNALSYMHHFGTTRFLKTNSSSLTSLAVARTLGYMASGMHLSL
ncbi:hypothetical protein QUC31_003883 [Theobroma cacao]